MLLMSTSSAWLPSKRRHIPSAHSFLLHMFSYALLCSVGGRQKLGSPFVTSSYTPSNFLKLLLLTQKKDFWPVLAIGFSKCCVLVLHFEPFASNRCIFLPIISLYTKFRIMLPRQNSGLDCKALTPEGIHPETVYFS